MSAGEALRAAVRQKLTAALEEVLVLVQTTVGDYEDQLNQSKEETERLRTRLLQLEPSEAVPSLSNCDAHSEMRLQSHIKEEEPDMWTIQDQDQLRESGSGPSNTPRSTQDKAEKRNQHLQLHPERPPNHKMESDDSDEECPICKQLDRRPASQGSGATKGLDSNREEGSGAAVSSTLSETNTKNTTKEFADGDEDVKPSKPALTEVQMNENEPDLESLDMNAEEDNNKGYDHLNKTTEMGQARVQEEAEPSKQKRSDLKRQAENEEQQVVSKFRRTPGSDTSPRRQEQMEESDSVVSSNVEKQPTTAAEGSVETQDGNEASNIDNNTENITSEPMEQEGVTEKETQISDDGQSSSQFSMAVEKGMSLEGQNVSSSDSKGTNTEDQSKDKTVDPNHTESHDQGGLCTLKPEPAVNLLPLDFVKSSVEVCKSGQLLKSKDKKTKGNGLVERKKSKPGSSSRVLPTKTQQQNNDCETEDSEDEQMDKNSTNEEENRCKVSGSVQTSSPLPKSVSVGEFVKGNTPKSKRHPQTNLKEQRKGASESEDLPFRRRLNRKAKSKAKRPKRKKVNGESETDSGSDTDKYDDSDYKIEDSTDSEDSEEDYHRIRVKKSSKNNLRTETSKKRSSNNSERSADNLSPRKSNGGMTSGNGKSRETSDRPSTSSDCGPGSPQKAPAKRKNDEKHECSECGSTFKLKGNLMMHMVVHKEERPFECSACDKTFKRKLNLQIHMSTHSGEKEFECSVCKKRFTRKFSLDDHMKTHTGGKPYSCSVCKSGFTCRSNLRRHMRSHTGQRPFNCDVCGKKFARKSILLEHMTSHTGEQAFSCPVCKKKFSRKHNLLIHSEIHREEKRFECSECGRRFRQRTQLQQHMLGHTGEKPYQCTVCKKSFTRKPYVKQHMEMYCLGAAQKDKTKKEEADKEK